MRSPFPLGQTWQGCECVFVDPGSRGLWIHVSEHQTHPCSGQNRYHTANPRGIGAGPYLCIIPGISWSCQCVWSMCVWWPFAHHFWASNKRVTSGCLLLLSLLLFFFFFKLYITVLVLPNIKMNPPQVYMCSPSWTLLPPPSPFHPSDSMTF